VLGRLAREAGTAGKAEKGELKEGHRVKYHTGSVGTVHHVDDKGTPHVVWDRGRGKPVATPAKHLTRINGEERKVATEEKPEIVFDRRFAVESIGKITADYGGDTYGWQKDVKAGRVKRISVPVSKLRALQGTFPGTVESYGVRLGKGENVGIPVVAKVGDHYLLLDGNNKAAAHVARGATSLDVHLVTPHSLEERFREVAAPPPPRGIAHPKSLKIAGSANRGEDDNKRMRQAVLRASTIQSQHTPALVGKTDITITKTPHGKRDTSTLASHTGSLNTLHVKPEVLVGSNAEAVRKANVGGWWVKTDAHHQLSDNVLIHEYGHGVHGMLTEKGIMRSTKLQPKTDLPAEQRFWQGFADALGVERPAVMEVPVTRPGPGGKGYATHIEPQMNVGQWLFRSQTNNAIARHVSKYAATNQNEMLAELWTEYKLSSSPRAPAKYFGDWVTQQLGKAGGG
jgi:hypothetical protein